MKIELRDLIYQEIDSLFILAKQQEEKRNKKIAAREILRKRNQLGKRESTALDLRVFPQGISFYIYWYKIKFVKVGSKVIRKTKFIKPYRGIEYKLDQFNSVSEWEFSLIQDDESVFSPIRTRLRYLTKMHRNLHDYCRHGLGKKMIAVPIAERCSFDIKSIKQIKNKFLGRG